MEPKQIDILVRKMYALADLAHVEHVNARGIGSYAKHVALGDFYSAVNDAKDSLIEYLMGQGRLLKVTADIIELGTDVVVEADTVVRMYEQVAIGDEALVNKAAGFKEVVGKLKYLLMLQ